MLEFRLSAMPQLAPRDLKVVLYCKTSGRAALAAGDGARAHLDADHFLHNPGTAPADYLVILGRITS